MIFTLDPKTRTVKNRKTGWKTNLLASKDELYSTFYVVFFKQN